MSHTYHILSCIIRITNPVTGYTSYSTSYYGMLMGESSDILATARAGRNPLTGNRNLYGGKEYLTTAGANLLDFTARTYDPSTLLFHTPDPLRDRYIHVHSCLYCSADPVNRIDPTGKGWKDEKAKEYAEKLKDNIDKRINTIENDIEKSENKIDELSRKNKDTAKESRKIERSAYRVQYSFDNNSLPSSVDGIGYIINPWIYNLKDTNGNWLYPSLHHSK